MRCASAVATTRPTRSRRSRSPPAWACRSRRCCTACANTAASRIEPIGQIGQVEFFDDSKGTNVGATVAALGGLGADRAPAKLVVILGGDGKGQDFAPLAEPVARHARAVALIGRDAPAIEQALAAVELPKQRLADLPAAVRWCFEQARSGDAVLLSPACASLDMF